ncbi:peptidoglycan editing factor PgeF [Clostridium felsineum]|uniref:Purine nucleoside phosphorylase n=1 Tax=Clostridium felsineum TaxID=36839 RepID=A0A1S8ME00_9CLOT|nr:peptidoglycan editing factor PgeF [Clostridium felsineum]URZ00835.1 Polyphenol oxidase [Clostridium felsineum]URZ06525.1 Polyphenol oxidase [Clostridium felsineum]URZ11560.1 Polyphenol oxidase [Clostridium felsineum]
MYTKKEDKYSFLEFKDDNFELYFSTAENNLNFNINTTIGIENLRNLKKWFNLDDVGYLKQTHSDIILNYEEDKKGLEGDALITDKNNIAIGVFTADCVPVLLYDKVKKVIGAVHSGWKGTCDLIVKKTICKMKKEFSSIDSDIVVYIGPHNKSCCYEFGAESLSQFENSGMYNINEIYKNGKLDLQKCIIKQCESENVYNIKCLDICTMCSSTHKMHSYRRDSKNAGRMFSFIIKK